MMGKKGRYIYKCLKLNKLAINCNIDEEQNYLVHESTCICLHINPYVPVMSPFFLTQYMHGTLASAQVELKLLLKPLQ